MLYHPPPHHTQTPRGKTSVFAATVQCTQLLLKRHPAATHVMLASGTHLPLAGDPFSHPCVEEGVSWLPGMTPVPEIAVAAARLALQEMQLMEGVVSEAYPYAGCLFQASCLHAAADG